MTAITVTREEGLYGGHLLKAEVVDDGHFYSFSRYPDESAWIADAHIGPRGYPYFVHGTGSRCTAGRTPKVDLATAIDEAAFRAGLAPDPRETAGQSRLPMEDPS